MIQVYRDFKAGAKRKRSSLWPKARREKKKHNPICEACGRGGLLSKWLIFVHHILPFHLFPEKELDQENLISLCAWCHLILGHLRNWKSWNKNVRKDAAYLLQKIKERP